MLIFSHSDSHILTTCNARHQSDLFEDKQPVGRIMSRLVGDLLLGHVEDVGVRHEMVMKPKPTAIDGYR